MRLSQDVVKKIRQIEISTRRLLHGSMAGESKSAIKGSGFEFDQIREYQLGDDIRSIDWKGSARSNKLLVKQYIEEKTHTIMLVVDVSGSTSFSSTYTTRADIMAHMASVLAVAGDQGKDSVGLILFSDHIEKYIPPNRGKVHVRFIMETLYSHKPQGRSTRVSVALEKLMQVKVHDGIALMISDFIDHNPFERIVRIAAKKYDLVTFRCLDDNEYALPAVGFVTVEDPETGQITTVDLRRRHSLSIHTFLKERLKTQEKFFRKCGIECVDIKLNKPFMPEIIRFFRRRMR